MPHTIVVCRYRDGKMIKGHTDDFHPDKDVFHVHMEKEGEEPRVVDVYVPDLKAVFFVKSLEGRKEYKEKKTFEGPAFGLKIVVELFDGEILVGTAAGYRRERKGFFMNPVDPESNNERIFIVSKAVNRVLVGAEAEEFLKDHKD